jgi:hypothetical protein
MNAVMSVHQQIADHWHSQNPRVGTLFANDDAFAAFYTSKYLIQDTAEAVWAHMRKGFSSDPMTAYVEFWGIMQALIIQQDAICELHESVCGAKPTLTAPSPWHELRDLRNRCAGHPAARTARGGTLRSFMGRSFGPYERITYEQYDSAASTRTHPTFNLRAHIGSYDAQAAGVLSVVLAEMRRKSP